MKDFQILLFTNEFKPVGGGVATYCYEIANAISDMQLSIAVVATEKGSRDPFFDKAQSFPVHRVKEYSNPLFRHTARLFVLSRWVKKYQPNILWAADWRSGIVVALVALMFNLPYVVMTHGTELLIANKSRLKKLIANKIYGKATRVFSNSYFTKQLLVDFGVSESKITVTLLGTSIKEWESDPSQVKEIVKRHKLQNKRVILTLARLTPRKGQDVVLKVLPEVLKKIPNIVYVIAGRGADEQRLRQLVADLALEDVVVFAGFVDDAEKSAYYHACEVYIMPNRQDEERVEGFGITFLEAGACGKPVIAGRHGGAIDAVLEGKTGILVDPLDVTEVSAALLKILGDPILANQLGENARYYVETEANWHNVAKRSLQALKDIL